MYQYRKPPKYPEVKAYNNTSNVADRNAIVISWIHTLPEYTAADAGPPPITTEKRRREQQQPIGSLALIEEAPRPSLSSLSIPSCASSPKNQMLNLRLYEPVIEFNALDLNALPRAARELVSSIIEIGSSQDILPHAVKSTIMEAVDAQDPMPRLWRYAFKSAADDEADALLPGRIPAFGEVERICRQAREWQQYDHEEVSWNCTVHGRLLELIFQDENGQLYDDPNDLCAKTTQFNRLAPTATVSHIDFVPIGTRPLVPRIKTKESGVHWQDAQLQIGIWHAAQWAFLRWAATNKLQRGRIDEGGKGGGSVKVPQGQEEGHDAFEAKVLSVMSDLGFIPGIIIQGHRWHLVLSTYENRKAKLWTDRQFGSTQTCLESYSIIAGMRRLMAWERDVYMPWFKSNILDNI
ncbi:hypothetical protein GQX73_g8796 [Xylaria multiplex]|uniref:PD-(D/E)XK nuclease-like domain-containing protein n=1 Tax=Xylaria multiplex TaxID=323545 RepID=A0A7C8IVF4_9PEZI|nr:hypothetical protein GQX73_g8796 [Xylaria multiplex]